MMLLHSYTICTSATCPAQKKTTKAEQKIEQKFTSFCSVYSLFNPHAFVCPAIGFGRMLLAHSWCLFICEIYVIFFDRFLFCESSKCFPIRSLCTTSPIGRADSHQNTLANIWATFGLSDHKFLCLVGFFVRAIFPSNQCLEEHQQFIACSSPRLWPKELRRRKRSISFCHRPSFGIHYIWWPPQFVLLMNIAQDSRGTVAGENLSRQTYT